VVEPALAERGACFLTGYPASLGAMARRRPGRPEVSERFEGFVGGVELVNGYEELTDPSEQEARLLALTDRHRRSTGESLPVDPGFLDALRRGLPPCAGAALGSTGSSCSCWERTTSRTDVPVSSPVLLLLLSFAHMSNDIAQGALPAMLPFLKSGSPCRTPPRGRCSWRRT